MNEFGKSELDGLLEPARLVEIINHERLVFAAYRADVEPVLKAAKDLALLGLQSDRYAQDPDYREAVDNVIYAVANCKALEDLHDSTK